MSDAHSSAANGHVRNTNGGMQTSRPPKLKGPATRRSGRGNVLNSARSERVLLSGAPVHSRAGALGATRVDGTIVTMADSADAWVELPSRDLLQQLGVEGSHGFIPQMFRLVAAHPRVARRFAALSQEVMRGEPSALTVAEREMVAAVTAAAQDCFY